MFLYIDSSVILSILFEEDTLDNSKTLDALHLATFLSIQALLGKSGKLFSYDKNMIKNASKLKIKSV